MSLGLKAGGRFFNIEKQKKTYDSKSIKTLRDLPIMKKLQVILGNQLFPIEEVRQLDSSVIFMAEDHDLCSKDKHHKLKILNFLVSMREYRDLLIKEGFKVFYFSIDEAEFVEPYESKLLRILKSEKIKLKFNFDLQEIHSKKKLKIF